MVYSPKERKNKLHQGCLELQNEESGTGACLSVSYLDPQVKVRMSFLLSLSTLSDFHFLPNPKKRLCRAPLLKIASGFLCSVLSCLPAVLLKEIQSRSFVFMILEFSVA